MSNAAADALDGLKALEDEALAAHKRIAEALDAARFCEAAIQMVEISITEICRLGGEEKPDGRE